MHPACKYLQKKILHASINKALPKIVIPFYKNKSFNYGLTFFIKQVSMINTNKI